MNSTPREEITALKSWVNAHILDQEAVVDRLLIALLADGHLLVEGPPGLAKTRAVRSLADGIDGVFCRIQFTPDLLPGDITGTDIFVPTESNFRFQKGPIFHNLVLADEVNRAPAKVQAALLEAMAERQVSIGGTTRPLPQLFLVMATQNPIEQEGTYPLPEAQLDRFLMHVRVGYPSIAAERRILELVRAEDADDAHASATPNPKVSQQSVFAARAEVLALHQADAVSEYIVQLVAATRAPERWVEELSGSVRCGASPRASIALERCARAMAWLDGRDFVSPDDVQLVAPDVLRHRLLLSFEAEAKGLDADRLIASLLLQVPVS